MAVLTGNNRAKPEEAATWVDQIEKYEAEKATIMAEAMKKCATVQERINAELDDAKSKGWAKKTIKDAIKIRKLDSKLRELMAEQEQDTAEDLDKVIKALGGLADLPLGKFVVEEKAPPKAKTPEQEAERNAAINDAVQADEAKKKSPKKDAKPDDEFYDSKAGQPTAH